MNLKFPTSLTKRIRNNSILNVIKIHWILSGISKDRLKLIFVSLTVKEF